MKVFDDLAKAHLKQHDTEMLSVNQTMAQIKLTEMWKARTSSNNPLNFQPKSKLDSQRITRSVTNEKIENTGFSTISKNTFIEDAKKVWNMAPTSIKDAKSLYTAKKS